MLPIVYSQAPIAQATVLCITYWGWSHARKLLILLSSCPISYPQFASLCATYPQVKDMQVNCPHVTYHKVIYPQATFLRFEPGLLQCSKDFLCEF
jgi:hypothetical protein